MIVNSISLKRRMVRETARHAGSQAVLIYYSGLMPATCEDQASGERIASGKLSEDGMREIAEGHEPFMVSKAGYWRVLDNNGNVVMQGDGNGKPIETDQPAHPDHGGTENGTA